MKSLSLPLRWSNAPAFIVGAVIVLVLTGLAVIIENEAAYRYSKAQETRVQAEILAASVTAALDFGDRQVAQEAVDAVRVNRQLRTIGIFDSEGRLVAGYGRDGALPPDQEAGPYRVGDRAIASSVPVLSRGERIGTVYLAAEPEPLSRRITRYLVVALLVLMAAIVVAVLGLTQNALRRANRELADRAEALSSANAELTVQISERAKAEDQLRQAQKMQALGQLTGGIAHDFNNLLTVIQGSADMLRRPELKDSKRIRFAEAIVQAASRAAALTGQLLAFARRQPLQPEVIEVNTLVSGMSDLLNRSLGERIVVRTSLHPGMCRVEADRAQLESAILNVAVNARDAMPEGGQLTISTAHEEDPELGAMIAITIADSGSGIDEEVLSRVFEPFYTTKAIGKGTGLGLSQVYGFATQSGGDVRIESVIDEGTSVTLLLPCSNSESGTESEKGGPAAISAKRAARILLVEDNAEVGAFAHDLLAEMGHHVFRVQSGEEALEAAHKGTFDLVFTDVVMPGISGLELAEQLARTHPSLPVVLTTGYSDQISRSGAGGRPVLLKPYGVETLAEAIDQALPDSEGW